MAKTYTPQRDSLPGRMVAFFQANPDEELTLDDVHDKFDVPSRGSIHSLLAEAVKAGLLARSDESGDWLYTRGAGLKAAPADPSPPVAPLASAWSAPIADVDPLQAAIEDGVPVPRKGRPTVDWTVLLKRLSPGQSSLLSIKQRYLITKAITDAHKASLGKFVTRVTADKTGIRVWRTE